MPRLFITTFLVLGWAWWELSGGSNFVPGEHGVTVLAQAPVTRPAPSVARGETSVSLTSVPQQADRNPVPRAPVIAAPAPVTPQPVAPVKPTQPAPLPVSAGQPAAIPAATAPATDIEAAIAKALGTPIAPEPAKVAEVQADPVQLAAAPQFMAVTGSRVNLRDGPGTSFGIVTQLVRGDEVEVLESDGTGWMRLRSLNGSRIGWMSDDFLTPIQ